MRSKKFSKLLLDPGTDEELEMVTKLLPVLAQALRRQAEMQAEMQGQWLRQKLLSLRKPEGQDRFIRQQMSRLPEEWRADLESLRERWFKRNYSQQKIRYLTLKHLFDMILADIKIKIDNLLLFSHKIK